MKITLRRATPADAAAIAGVEITTWQSAYRGLVPEPFLNALSVADQTERWCRSLVRHQHGELKRTLVAVIEDRVVGFGTVGRVKDEPGVGLIYLIYVLPDHWRSGVGRALMGAMMNELRDLRLPEAFLWVLRDNWRARQFYQSLGWHPDGRVRTDDYGGVELEALCYRRAVA